MRAAEMPSAGAARSPEIAKSATEWGVVMLVTTNHVASSRFEAAATQTSMMPTGVRWARPNMTRNAAMSEQAARSNVTKGTIQSSHDKRSRATTHARLDSDANTRPMIHLRRIGPWVANVPRSALGDSLPARGCNSRPSFTATCPEYSGQPAVKWTHNRPASLRLLRGRVAKPLSLLSCCFRGQRSIHRWVSKLKEEFLQDRLEQWREGNVLANLDTVGPSLDLVSRDAS
jgi:hypothetical protein